MDDVKSISVAKNAPTITMDTSRIMDAVERGWSLYSSGRRIGSVRSSLSSSGIPDEELDLILDIVLTRKQSRKKFSKGERLFFTSSGLRWATPEVAADHCARRMRCERMVDLACGQGGQALSFSNGCSEVVAVDKDPVNLFIAHLNCIAMEADNVELICGDSLSGKVSETIGKANLAFCDPARPPGSPERSMNELLPDPREVLRIYSNRLEGLCIEVPPYISQDRIPFECESEYVSIDDRINRLNLYTGSLMRAPSSCVILPGGESLSGEPGPTVRSDVEISELGRYLYELDPAVVRSGLAWKAVENISDPDVIRLDERRTLLSSNRKLSSSFFKEGYRYAGNAKDISALVELLNEMGVGSVTLRWGLEPSDYWKVRNSIESKLSGRAKVQVFRYRESFLVLDKIKRSGGL